MRTNIKINIAVAMLEVVFNTSCLLYVYRTIISSLGQDVLGIWSLIGAAATLAQFGNTSVADSLTRFVASSHTEKQFDAALLIETGIFLILSFSVILSIIIYIPSIYIIHALSNSYDFSTLKFTLLIVLVSFSLAGVSGVILSSISGLHKGYLRSIISMTGTAVMLGMAAIFVPVYGLPAIALSQAIQAIVALALGWCSLRFLVPGLRPVPCRWSVAAFRTIVGYGVKLQVSSLAIFLFEPVNKFMMARLGGLDYLASYEITLRIITQSRALVVAAFRQFVPLFAKSYSEGKSSGAIFQRSRIYTATSSVAVSALAIFILPFLHFVMGIKIDMTTVLIAIILCLGWGLNTTIIVIYYFFIGTGLAKFTMISHCITALVSPVAGLVLGWLYGAPGVAAGAMIGLNFATLYLLVQFRRVRTTA